MKLTIFYSKDKNQYNAGAYIKAVISVTSFEAALEIVGKFDLVISWHLE